MIKIAPKLASKIYIYIVFYALIISDNNISYIAYMNITIKYYQYVINIF